MIAVTSKNVDLSNCDREQIQYPSAILPHGVLLVLREPELRVVQVSANVAEALGGTPEQLLGAELASWLSAEELEAIQSKIGANRFEGAPTRVAVVKRKEADWNVLAHRHDEVLFLEFEPRPRQTLQLDADYFSELRPAIAKLQGAKSCQEFLDLAVRQIREFSGMDRVMAYKFLEDGSGWVRSESVVEGQTAYLGMHFPASDIPAPARRLFTLSWVRHQPDIGYTPVAVIPEQNPVTGRALDMSYAVLRSVSTMYSGYLKNMGTHSSMVMTLLKDGKLWGLIACHHHQGPKFIPYEVRVACEFLANMVSLLLGQKEDLEFAEYKLRMKESLAKFITELSRTGQFVEVLLESQPNLLDFVRSEGAALATDGEIYSIGRTPEGGQIAKLVEWMAEKVKEEVFACDSLSALYPPAEQYSEVGSGVLAVRFAATKKDYVLWFRPEVVQLVKWAGDPRKPVEVSEDGQRLLPRTSFALWKESVRQKSQPWLDFEVAMARDLRVSMLEVVIRRAEELGELYKNLQRSHMELDAFAYVASHDLKEPLRGIHNYSQFLLEDCAGRLGPEDVQKLRALTRLSQRMEDLLDSLLHYSRVNRAELSRREHDLNAVVADVLELLSARIQESGAQIRIPRTLPQISAHGSTISEVFSNLISNALKYNDKSEKWVEIGFQEEPGDSPVLFVRDNGIGIDAEYQQEIFLIFRRLHKANEFGGGTGAGLTIAKKIVERHGGQMWVESKPGEGSTFYFTVDSGRTKGNV